MTFSSKSSSICWCLSRTALSCNTFLAGSTPGFANNLSAWRIHSCLRSQYFCQSSLSLLRVISIFAESMCCKHCKTRDLILTIQLSNAITSIFGVNASRRWCLMKEFVYRRIKSFQPKQHLYRRKYVGYSTKVDLRLELQVCNSKLQLELV